MDEKDSNILLIPEAPLMVSMDMKICRSNNNNSTSIEEELSKCKLKHVDDSKKHYYTLKEIIDLHELNEDGKMKRWKFDFYCFESKKWVIRKDIGDGKMMKKIKIMTLNTWFSEFKFNERFEKQIELFKSNDPDVIALQECNHYYMKNLAKSKFIRENYCVSDNPDNCKIFRQYGNIFLLKRNLNVSLNSSRITKFGFPSRMSRYLLYFKVNNRITISTSHLESTKIMSHFRKIQINSILEEFKSEEKIVFVGDMNIGEKDKEENQNLLKNNVFIDAWKEIYPNNKGYTVNAKENLMINGKGYGTVMARIDRILLKNIQPKSIRIIGNKSSSTLFCSDHFGLYSELIL